MCESAFLPLFYSGLSDHYSSALETDTNRFNEIYLYATKTSRFCLCSKVLQNKSIPQFLNV